MANLQLTTPPTNQKANTESTKGDAATTHPITTQEACAAVAPFKNVNIR